MLVGPEVWLDALSGVETSLVHPEAKAGPFSFSVTVESPSGKAIRIVDAEKKVTLRGMLVPAADDAVTGKKR